MTGSFRQGDEVTGYPMYGPPVTGTFKQVLVAYRGVKYAMIVRPNGVASCTSLLRDVHRTDADPGALACPYCKAEPMRPCHRRGDPSLTQTMPHPSRWAAAAEAAK